MTRLQALLISLSISFAVVAGTYAAMQTTKLGTGATTHVSATAIADQRKALNRTAVALRKAYKQRPPKLPPVRRPRALPPRIVYAPAPASVPVTHTTAAPPATVRKAPATHTHSSPAPSEGEGRDGGPDD